MGDVTFIGNYVVEEDGSAHPLPDFIEYDGAVTPLTTDEADLLAQTIDWADGRDR